MPPFSAPKAEHDAALNLLLYACRIHHVAAVHRAPPYGALCRAAPSLLRLRQSARCYRYCPAENSAPRPAGRLSTSQFLLAPSNSSAAFNRGRLASGRRPQRIFPAGSGDFVDERFVEEGILRVPHAAPVCHEVTGITLRDPTRMLESPPSVSAIPSTAGSRSTEIRAGSLRDESHRPAVGIQPRSKTRERCGPVPIVQIVLPRPGKLHRNARRFGNLHRFPEIIGARAASNPPPIYLV